ncbi:hypothetical protein DP73_07160 [Desulfosporosinus sp. HMP52]|uniref:hypothetical protein n=1 Tax=Desulfosporosinus sp. HMP52 TaxID=1487923 RepID=UPI00051FB6FA|nr:hypothetical protein [Desulfosporosinus sp. HMP52]KGK90415.1 hypothetical protein DP73_07160 [Desulfosporosinus sp. HMP52]
MVWPKRKIQLAASSAVPGISGVRAVLEEIQLDYSMVEPNQEDLNREFKENWLDKPFDGNAVQVSEVFSPVTELIFWPDLQEEDSLREKAFAKGIKFQSVQSFIHNLLEDDLIIWISEPAVLINERPLLSHILNQAGFEPTILWATPDGKWQCEWKEGVYWLISESWLDGLMEKNTLGRRVGNDRGNAKAAWEIRENQIDFYRSQDRKKFVGHLPRWPKLSEEKAAVQNIAMCIDLGLSWLDIRLALSSIWKNERMADNLRWNINDFGWNAGACREELSAP